jgi:UDP-2,3-diacylglucosamine pyrophosphatase LpxH/glycosyltransferase involved in cell wall biosynthesis
LGRLVGGLKLKGHEVHIIHTAEGGATEGETHLRGVSLPGYHEVRVGLPKPLKFKWTWRARRPDVVYIATESPMGASAAKACRKLAIPCVMGFHTNFDQYLSRYHLEGVRPLAVSYLRKIHGRANLTLVPTDDVRDRLIGCGFDRIEVMGRGVDTGLFSPRKRSQTLRDSWGARPATLVAVVVGRVAPEKNLGLAIRAFEKMRKQVPDLVAVIVGDGPSRKSLEKKYPWVIFAGMRKGEDLAAHYASSDILLFPSETETFGNVTLEGMASGLVTVGYDYAAARTHVEQGANGLKAPLGDEEVFIRQAVMSLASDRWSDLRKRARVDAEKQSWGGIVEEFENHLRKFVPAKLERAGRAVTCDLRGNFRFKTVILSDIHLGTPDCKAEELCEFLRKVRCERLILNGDIIDGWALRKGGKWLPAHTKLIRTILRKMEKEGTEVIYLRGNHDDILERFLPLTVGGLEVTKEYLYVAEDGRKYLVVHGDGFDQVSTNYRWLARAGAVGYDWLLRFNRSYNWWRERRGKEYYSLSKAVKAKVKASVSFVGRYEEQLQEFARIRGCDGIICGHIHTPADEQVGEVHYLNSGDWVESLTGIVEHIDGGMELFSYEDFLGWQQVRSDVETGVAIAV